MILIFYCFIIVMYLYCFILDDDVRHLETCDCKQRKVGYKDNKIKNMHLGGTNWIPFSRDGMLNGQA